MKEKLELLDDSIKELTNLRVSLIHNDFLEKKVYDIEANLCKLHDLLSTPQPEPEGANMGTVLTEKMVEDHKVTGGYKDWDVKPEADFYLEIYASRDTFSRAKIMEMFRDYHNVKLSNIKKVVEDELKDFKAREGAQKTPEGVILLTDAIRTLEYIKTELLKQL